MPKETITNPSEGGLVRLKYTFRFGDQFVEPDDDWLKCVENTSDELLGAYSKSEDNALSAAFGSQKKKRLNRVFDAIRFVYPDYCYPPRRQKRKGATSGKVVASAAPSEPAAKRKKLKVLTHRPRYIESATMPEFDGETSAVAEAKEPAPPTQEIKEPAVMPKAPSSKLTETRVNEDKAEKSKTKEAAKMPEILSPLAEATVLKAEKGYAITPRRKRMVNVLDILETTDSERPSSMKKVAKSAEAQAEADTRQMKGKTATIEAGTEAEPIVLAETKLASAEQGAEEVPPNIDIAFERNMAKEVESLAPEAPSEYPDYIIRHALGKRLSEEEIFEAKHYARELKYLKGALVFNGMDEDDFLYCLPDNKELSVCREMARSMGFPKLEVGLCAMTKDDLADSHAYNSLKVQKIVNFEVYEF
jgi:hypothetical protein